MYNFPDTPALNSVVTTASGGSYIWDGTKWATGSGYTGLTLNALIKGQGAGAAPIASTATVDGSGNLTVAGTLTVGNNANPSLMIESGAYTTINAPDANAVSPNYAGIHIGNAGNPNNFYRQTNHVFQNRTAATTYATVDSSGNLLMGGGIAVTGNATLQLLTSAGYTMLYAPDGTGTTGVIQCGNAGNPNIFLRNTTTNIQNRNGTVTYASFGSGGVSLNGITCTGNASITGQIYSLGANAALTFEDRGAAGTNYLWYNTSATARLWNGSDRLTVGPTGTCQNTTGTWSAISDRRIKKDVEPYTRGLDAIIQLNPISFKFNGRAGLPQDGITRYGLIADDVAEIIPEVTGEVEVGAGADGKSEEGTFKTFDPGQLTYALINAVKELAARMAELEAQRA